MKKLEFKTAEQLRAFYQEQGFFGIYDCATEYGDVEINHYALLSSGEPVSLGCEAHQIIPLTDEKALSIIDRFLKTGGVEIHPKVFTL